MARPCPTGRHDEHNVYAENCPCRALLDLISNKWSALVIGMLDERSVVRFSELQAVLPGVGSKMLTQTLRRLEAASLVERTVYAEVPPRVEYTLSELGRSAAVPLGQIRTWAEEHIDQVEFLNRKWSEQS
ncbi:winged helix-turn-helix transcriptional regulator [Mycolicibacterium fortuitum]|uniref:winged helix-turn-helix transcriptional regulator n=1 Tax=Mycolicibacterium fortuitum TaxID=1766 RepID=UPI0007EAF7DB|nr:helix-turn-helix domain-containing protein [Mycolicibacterium fortuitum]OBG42474.1 cinnamoyl ester hydrolase [Mycolicibacterium fortuitum]OBJ99286.1 cinnamoyl ester hydrolase [Mycolicibacterium fortuitum]